MVVLMKMVQAQPLLQILQLQIPILLQIKTLLVLNLQVPSLDPILLIIPKKMIGMVVIKKEILLLMEDVNLKLNMIQFNHLLSFTFLIGKEVIVVLSIVKMLQTSVILMLLNSNQFNSYHKNIMLLEQMVVVTHPNGKLPII